MTDQEVLEYLKTLDFKHTIEDYGDIWLGIAIEHDHINSVSFLLDKFGVPDDCCMNVKERLAYYKLFIRSYDD